MCHWMQRNWLFCYFGHFLKRYTKPFLEETRYMKYTQFTVYQSHKEKTLLNTVIKGWDFTQCNWRWKDKIIQLCMYNDVLVVCVCHAQPNISTYMCLYFFLWNEVLPKRPKPQKIVTLTTVAFGGWSVVCDQVLQLFGPLCKDPEYMLLLHLFDELLPLLFFLYNTVFKGGDLNQWLTVLLVVISINGLQYFCEFPWCSLYLEGATTTKPHCVSYQTSFITWKKVQKLLLQCESFCKFWQKRKWKYSTLF